jgi:hypothetical protein
MSIFKKVILIVHTLAFKFSDLNSTPQPTFVYSGLFVSSNLTNRFET